jgi:glycosyltransferase involved in cell wall biosynthesis
LEDVVGVSDPERPEASPASPRTTTDAAISRSVPCDADVVYFLMYPGWDRELRSNRWHYATRWARLLPVVLVQPTEEIAGHALTVRKEPRIENCHVLQIQASNYGASYLEDVLVQVGQVTADMEIGRRRRALLWCYNPMLFGLYAALPAVGRVFHATENYFHFENVPRLFLHCQRAAVQISDLTVAVSHGVATALRENIPGAHIEIVTNGCDYEEYSRYRPDARLRTVAGEWERVAIYAGNINARLDFILLERCVAAHPRMLYVLVGPVAGLDAADAARWKGLLVKPNVRHLGEQDPKDLPGLYGAADVGIVPYKQTRLLVENGFPLKVLEMCATGLPVVSTFMKPIVGLTEGLVVARDHDAFLEKLSWMSRAGLTDAQKNGMNEICQHHDYNRKIETVLSLLRKTGSDTPAPATTKFDAVVHLLGAQWGTLGVREWKQRATWASTPFVARLFPMRVLKGLLALRMILGDPSLRTLLISGVVLRCWGATIELSRLVPDLFRLGILRLGSLHSRRLGPSVEVQLHYDAQGKRLVAETIEPGDTLSQSQSGIDSLLFAHPPVREILWDHSAIGTVVPIVIAGRPAWVFVGPDGQYRFRALAALAERDPESVWAAFRLSPGGAGPLR